MTVGAQKQIGTVTCLPSFSLCVLCASAAIFFFGSESAHGQVDLRLAPLGGELAVEPAASQPAGACRAAVLSVANHSSQPVRAVAVRMIEGGPTWLWPLAVPPDANASLAVSVPVQTLEQGYALRALAGERADSPAIATSSVTVSWPTGPAAPFRLLRQDLYQDHEDKIASWPMGFRRELFLAVAAGCIALAGAVLLRRRAWKLAAVAAVAVGATVAILLWVERRGDVAQYAVASSSAAEPNAPQATLLIVSSPRTTAWRHPSSEIIPLYGSPGQMARDDAVIQSGRGISLTVHAGELRVFQVPSP